MWRGRLTLKIALDTNVIVRYLTRDDPEQAEQARCLIESADIIAIPTVVFAELIWVLRRTHRIPTVEIAANLRAILAAWPLDVDGRAVAAGLAMMDKGGDFADGVFHYEAMRGKSATLATFDRRLAARLPAEEVRLLGAG